MKRMIVFLLILAALLMLCCASALADTCQVWYKDFDEGGSQLSDKEVTATVVTSTTTRFLQTGYYVAIGDVTVPGRISCTTGNLHLILCDGAKLHISKGIFVPEGCHLTITSGRTVEGNSMYGTGELIIDNVSGIDAGIGGYGFANSGSITINDGRITVTGGQYCAAIGGGDNANGGIITINGGRIKATGGEDAAAIGGGKSATGGSVTINGGSIYADGGLNGAGIGGGIYSKSSLTINGGWIKAVGNGQSPGIGNYSVDFSLTVNGNSGNAITIWASSYRYNTRTITGNFCNENGVQIPINLSEWEGQYIRNIKANGKYSPTSYVDANGADMGSARCMTIGIDSTVWDDGSLSSGSGWYRTTSSTITDRITVVGDVNLILCDGSTLTAAEGITITEGSSLTVWTQSGGTGTLYAGTNGTDVTCAADSAGIGGGGTLIVNGGTVRACGNGAPAIESGVSFADSMKVTAAGVAVLYDSRVSACAGNEVTVTRCGHEAVFVPTAEDGWACMYCGHASGDAGIGCGTAADPWRIGSADTWNSFVTAITNGFNTEGRYFSLTNDITVSAMLGTKANPFAGTFDGGGKTLTVNLEASENITAPFRYIHNAAIKNLRAVGSVNTGYKFAGGIAGVASGNCAVTNCASSVAIHSGVSGDGTHGGIVSCMDNTSTSLTLTGCVFNGGMLGEDTTKCGGLVGWAQGSLTLRSCVLDSFTFEPASSKNFARLASGTSDTLENCYYRTSFDTQGSQAFTVTAGAGVAIDFGQSMAVYGVSGITAYAAGLMYGDAFYASQGDTVALNLTAEPWNGYETSFTASAGALAASDSGWTLTMSAEETVITALRTPTFATTPAVHLTSDGGTDGYGNQDPDKLFDGLTDNNSKWCCVFTGTNWVEFHSDVPVVPTAYSMTTAADTSPNYLRRNPYSWELLGKMNASDETWISIKSEEGNDHLPAENCVEIFFPLDNSAAYQYYRLNVTAVRGAGGQLQIGEFKLVGTPVFGTAAFSLPAGLRTIEESAFEDMTAMISVDAGSVTSVGANAFKDCSALNRIRLSKNCTIDPDAFTGCGTVYIFAPAGGSTEAYCNAHENCVFVEE